jgi:limonene-1,2-epoxide hydrolase
VTPEQVSDWLAGYRVAWETRSADAAAALFAIDARYYETPFSEPFEGREGIAAYWARVTADQRDIHFDSELLSIDGPRVIATWSARFVAGPDTTPVELNGIFLLEFDEAGLCLELREWWHAR